MQKYFFYIVLALTLCYNTTILAEKSDEPLYVNLLDTNDRIASKLVKALDAIKDKNSGIYLQDDYVIDDIFPVEIFKLTRESTATDNSKIKEEYILRLFNTTTFNIADAEINIETKPIYNSYFSSYLYTTIKDTTHPVFITQGMLPFLNTDYLRLSSNYSDDNQALLDIHKLLDKAKCVSRQLQLHKSIKNPAILKTITKNNITLLDIPDNTLFNFILYDPNHSIVKLLTYMYNVTSAVEVLHNKNIALGDIDLTNLFVLNDKLVLAKFESFNTINSTENNNGKIIISNSFGHAPEITTPFKINKPDYNKPATIQSDVYSLGSLFADMLYLFASPQFELRDLRQDDTFDSVEDKKMHLLCFNRHPHQLMSKIQNYMPIFSPHFLYQFKNFIGCYFRNLPEDSTDIIKKLTHIINLCNQQNPASRPTVTDLKEMLMNLLMSHPMAE